MTSAELTASEGRSIEEIATDCRDERGLGAGFLDRGRFGLSAPVEHR